MLKLKHLPPQVASRLASYYRLKRLYALMRVLFASASLYLLLALVAMHLDRVLFLEQSFRVGMFWVVHIVVAAVLLAGLGRFLLRPPGVRQIAYEMEGRIAGGAAEKYVTLDDVLEQGGRTDPVAVDLVAQLTAATVEHSKGLRSGRLVRDRRLGMLAIGLVLIGGATALLSGVSNYEFPLMVQRFLQPQANLPKPSFIKVNVTLVGDAPAIGRGGEAVLRAEISGQMPAALQWLMGKLGYTVNRCVIATNDGPSGEFRFDAAARADMSRVERSLYLYSRGNLQDSFAYRVRCGDAQTEVRWLEVVAQPRFTEIALTVTPPAYADSNAETFTDVRKPLKFLAGSKIKLSFKTDQPVASRTVKFEKGKDPNVDPDWDEATLTGTHEFTLRDKTAFEIKVVNDRGFGNVEQAKVMIGLREDTPPVVRLEYPTGDLEKVASEIVPMQGVVEDDLRVDKLTFKYVLNPALQEGAPAKELPITVEKPSRSLPLAATFDLEKTGAVPGDVVMVEVVAEDSARNHGNSRAIFIRVVPFTRQENERKRLAALGVVREALLQAAATPAEEGAVGEAMAIGKDPYAAILAAAKSAGLPMPAEGSMATVLELLQREQHFTDAPRHKEDVRKVFGVVNYACQPFAEEGDAYAFRAAQLKTLADDILPGLVRYRLVKNCMWRLFGMRYEAANIRLKAKELADLGKPSPDRNEALKRRAKLYRETLENIGVELIELSRTTPELDKEKIATLFGELNTSAARFMSSDSAKRRQELCDTMSEGVMSAMAMLRPLTVKFFEGEGAARAKLDAAYAQCLQRIAKGSAKLTPKWLVAADDWLAEDARLMERNPMLPVWRRFTNMALAEGLSDVQAAAEGAARDAAEAQRRKAAAAVLNPTPELAAHIRQDEAMWTHLEFTWQIGDVLKLDTISNTEKTLDVTLAELEEAACVGYKDAAWTNARTQRVATLDLSKDLPAAPQSPRPGECNGLSSPAEIHKTLIEAARGIFAFKPPGSEVEAMLALVQATEQKLSVAAKGADAAAVQDALRAATAESQRLHRLEAKLAMQASYLWQGQALAAQDDLLLIKLRELSAHYHARIGARLTALAAMSSEDLKAMEPVSLSADLGSIASQHAALERSLGTVMQAYRDGNLLSTENLKKYTILKDFARTRRYVQTTSELHEGKGDANMVRAFMDEFKEAGLAYLASQAELVDGVRAALLDGQAMLKAAKVTAKDFDGKLTAGKTLLAQMTQAVNQSGSGEVQERLGKGVEQLQARIARLELGDKPADAVKINRQLFELAEILKAVELLDRDVKNLGGEAELSESVMRGGPEGIWAKDFRYQAEHSRQRLADQSQLGTQSVTESVLEALTPKPRTAKYDEGLAWSVFLYRVVRGELYGIGGFRSEPASKPTDGMREIEYLKGELEKAKQVKNLRNYPGLVKEYLDTLGDFLRY